VGSLSERNLCDPVRESPQRSAYQRISPSQAKDRPDQAAQNSARQVASHHESRWQRLLTLDRDHLAKPFALDLLAGSVDRRRFTSDSTPWTESLGGNHRIAQGDVDSLRADRRHRVRRVAEQQ
jgi:hypothetical protein